MSHLFTIVQIAIPTIINIFVKSFLEKVLLLRRQWLVSWHFDVKSKLITPRRINPSNILRCQTNFEYKKSDTVCGYVLDDWTLGFSHVDTGFWKHIQPIKVSVVRTHRCRGDGTTSRSNHTAPSWCHHRLAVGISSQSRFHRLLHHRRPRWEDPPSLSPSSLLESWVSSPPSLLWWGEKWSKHQGPTIHLRNKAD